MCRQSSAPSPTGPEAIERPETTTQSGFIQRRAPDFDPCVEPRKWSVSWHPLKPTLSKQAGAHSHRTDKEWMQTGASMHTYETNADTCSTHPRTQTCRNAHALHALTNAYTHTCTAAFMSYGWAREVGANRHESHEPMVVTNFVEFLDD